MKIDELAIYENGQDGPEPEENQPEEIEDYDVLLYGNATTINIDETIYSPRYLIQRMDEQIDFNFQEEIASESSTDEDDIELEYEQQRKLKRIFDVFDTDQDGFISSRDLKDFANAMGADISIQGITQGFSDIDMKGSGTVNFEAFYSWWMNVNYGR